MGSLQRRRDGVRELLSTEHIVGRLPTCHLRLEATFVSVVHALIRWNGQGWEVRDLSSTNGTYLDGKRLATGTSAPVVAGAEIVFGESREAWNLVDDHRPVAGAVPEDGGAPSFLVSGAIAIPSAEDPLAVIYADTDRWFLEMEDVRRPMVPDQRIVVGGRTWRFLCPSEPVATGMSTPPPRTLADVTFSFSVSQNEEFVGLSAHSGSTSQQLGQRGCFHLAMVLCRERMNETRAGVPEPGWVDLDALLRMIPDYASASHVNVDIHRLRRALYDAGIEDAMRIIERRRGQIRFGVESATFLNAEGLAQGAAAR